MPKPNRTYVNGKWLYGDAWDKFPIQDREIWRAGQHRVGVFDLVNESTDQLFSVLDPGRTLAYVDPPWCQGNSAGFFTKAGRTGAEFNALLRVLLQKIQRYSPIAAYLEMGRQETPNLINVIEAAGATVTNRWDVVYYRKFPSVLMRLSFTSKTPPALDLNGVDDGLTPARAIASEPHCQQVVDFCTGRGLTGRTAHKLGKSFVGSELNRRRLANLLEWWASQGLTPQKVTT